MKLKFEINEDFLLESIIERELETRSPPHSHSHIPEDVAALVRKAQNYKGYRFLNPNRYAILNDWIGVQLDNLEEVEEFFSRHSVINGVANILYRFALDDGPEMVVEFAREIKKTQEYKNVLQSTEQYGEELITQWGLHYAETLAIMQDITGINFQDDRFVVYVTHPYYQGADYFRQKRIGFGVKETYPYGLVIALWHEILHDKIHSGDKASVDRVHVTIQLAAENELRVRLNKGMGQYPPFIGPYPHLFPTMQLILPNWREYLAIPNRNILEFHEKIRMQY